MQDAVSQLLVRWSSGDQAALEELMPIVYGELRRLGRSAIRRGGGDSILQPTALVHEVWLKMARDRQISMTCRRQFYALASKMMREIMVDHVRRRQAAKRGAGLIEVPFDDPSPGRPTPCVNFLILDQAITRLGEIRPRYQEIVELRFIAGLTIEETAEALNVTHATIEREWSFARLWLQRELQLDRQGPARHRATQ